MFDKLLADIEFFYSQMQNIGIDTTQEIVDPMECSQEEKNIRIQFFNRVLMAKRDYKSSLEKLKKEAKKQVNPNPTGSSAEISAGNQEGSLNT
jgi:uncharacterized FAD-dependent dehydrogenase